MRAYPMWARAKRLAGVAAGLGLSALAMGCAHRDAPSATLPESSSASAASATAPEAAAPMAESNMAIPKDAIDNTLNPQHLPAYSGPTGSVEGTITVIGPPSPDVKLDGAKCPAAVDTFGKLFREGTPAEPNGPRPLADAVVVATGYSGFYLPETRPSVQVTISVDCAYPARSIALTFGQPLEIKNLSKYPFAPIMDSDASPAVMMAAPLGAGDPIRLYPRRPGHAVMGDLMQTYAREDVYVLRFPSHAISGRDGHYRIDGLPVGKLSIGAQHPTVASQASAPVDIAANVVAKLDLTLEYAPKAPKQEGPRDQIVR
ncbi:MAG TPA: carboxypeptidase-like regulatory domain-containing protein [Polyangiaceae bacterium]|nr:carboxypeptidase-like regulatory domain-containing protein [Polyangiaceae bacterium]